MQEILYGAANSSLFGQTLLTGGMGVSTDIFVQSGVEDMPRMQRESRGQWRILSKLGAGYSGSRGKGEVLTNAYGCLPVLDDHGNAAGDRGTEFLVSARASVAGDTALTEAINVLQRGVACVTAAAYEGRLQGG